MAKTVAVVQDSARQSTWEAVERRGDAGAQDTIAGGVLIVDWRTAGGLAMLALLAVWLW